MQPFGTRWIAPRFVAGLVRLGPNSFQSPRPEQGSFSKLGMDAFEGISSIFSGSCSSPWGAQINSSIDTVLVCSFRLLFLFRCSVKLIYVHHVFDHMLGRKVKSRLYRFGIFLPLAFSYRIGIAVVCICVIFIIVIIQVISTILFLHRISLWSDF